MLTNEQSQFNEILEELTNELDISPSDFRLAEQRYKSVGKHLEEGDYSEVGIHETPSVYPQGSIRLGTIIKPLKEDKDGDYDIDLVCQMPASKEVISPEDLKQSVGDRLDENSDYRRMGEEGKRCWTIEYAKRNGVGFHMDILPCVPADDAGRRLLNERKVWEGFFKHAIDLTEYDKESKDYSWKDGGSNPEGYAQWFDNKKRCSPEYSTLSYNQKQRIYENTLDQKNNRIFASVDDVPELLVRTPLQRAVQILKRHRDLHFKENNKDNKPISIIITTLCARFYENERDIFSATNNIVQQIYEFSQYLGPEISFSDNVQEIKELYAQNQGIVSTIDKPIFKVNGQWWIPNPVNPSENFADRWDAQKARAFFEWLGKLAGDFNLALNQYGIPSISNILSPIFGENVIRRAFERIANKTRHDLDRKKIKTEAKSGVLIGTGTIRNPDHNFYA